MAVLLRQALRSIAPKARLSTDNATVAAAKATLRQAQQQVIEAEAAWWPQISLSAGVQRNGAGGFTPAGGGFSSSNFFSLRSERSATPPICSAATARTIEKKVKAQEDYQRIEVEAARLTLVGRSGDRSDRHRLGPPAD